MSRKSPVAQARLVLAVGKEQVLVNRAISQVVHAARAADPTALITETFLAGMKQGQELAFSGLSAWADAAGKASNTTTNTPAEPVKLVDPGLLAIDGVTTRGQLDRQIDERGWQAHDAAVYCNGNGACYNYDPDDAMAAEGAGPRRLLPGTPRPQAVDVRHA